MTSREWIKKSSLNHDLNIGYQTSHGEMLFGKVSEHCLGWEVFVN